MSFIPCEIVPVAKRRDGGTRYWCLTHKADATAKYGRPASECRYAHVPDVTSESILKLDVSQYTGGVALWGAVPPVYDTTNLGLDRGIHVHARVTTDSKKFIDGTYRLVEIVGLEQDGSLTISELDAIYFMVSSVFGHDVHYVECPYCNCPHLDKDWFSVHPHRRHLCAGCGRNFRDDRVGIGNPLARLRERLGVYDITCEPSCQDLEVEQSDYPGGLRIWGSNPAIIWTSQKAEQEGIHVHAFDGKADEPQPDETFSKVRIDDVALDAYQIRLLMAQSALPHLARRVISIRCPRCGKPHLDRKEWAYTPHISHTCEYCKHRFVSRTRLKKVISNPAISNLKALSRAAPRPIKTHELGLIVEAP